MYSRVAVTGDFKSPEEAIQWAVDNIDQIKLPNDAEYLADSFEIDEEGNVLDENGDIAN